MKTFSEIADSFFSAIFVLGIAAAGISSQFPNILVFPWMLSDYKVTNSDIKTPKMRLLLLGMVLLNLVVPFFGASPVLVMLASQAFIALILPSSVIGIFYLTSKKNLMGKHANNTKDKVILSLMSVFALIMSAVSLYDFITNINNL